MATYEAIEKELTRRMRASKTGSFEITMKRDGITLTLEPCSDTGNLPDNFHQCDFILIYGAPYDMSGTPDDVIKNIMDYKTWLTDWDNEKEKCKKYFEAHKHEDCQNNDHFSFYSDWHKEIFSFRPQGWRFG